MAAWRSLVQVWAAAISFIATVCKPAYLKTTVKLECGMILGLSTTVFTIIHVLISLIGIASGFVALGAMIRNKWSTGWNTVFLASTVATSATGFLFHSKSFGAPHVTQ
jgi:hypothetical protein